jgi:hypothetical protein
MKWFSDHRMAMLGVGVAAAYWPGMLQAVFVPRWAVIAVGVPLMSSLDPRAISPMMRIILLFLVGLGVVSLIASPDPMTGWRDVLFMVLLCLTFIAAASLGTLDDLMIGLGIGLAVSSVLSVMQVAGWSTLPQGSVPGGLFYNSEILGEFAALVFVWAVLRPVWIIAAFAAVPIVLCETRVGMIAAAIGLIYALVPRRRWILAAAIIALIAVGVVLLAGLGIGKIVSADRRAVLWAATIIGLTPLGHGLGWFQAAHPEQYAHSDALQAIAELGFLAIVLLAIPVKAFRSNRGNNAERALFAAVCVEVAISFPLHMPATGFLAAAVAGFLVGSGPRLCVGEYHGGTEDGAGLRRIATGDIAAVVRSRRGGEAISVRSVSTAIAPRSVSAACGA